MFGLWKPTRNVVCATYQVPGHFAVPLGGREGALVLRTLGRNIEKITYMQRLPINAKYEQF